MATRGRKPKPAHLRLVGGNAGKRPLPPIADPTPRDDPPVKPKGMRGKASQLWDSTVARAHWLAWSDSEKAWLWCYLAAEMEKSKGKTVAARIAQFRALGSELGFDPASRQRLGVEANPTRDDPSNEFV